MSDEFQPGRTEVIRGRIQSSEHIFFCEARGKAIVDALKGETWSPRWHSLELSPMIRWWLRRRTITRTMGVAGLSMKHMMIMNHQIE